MVRPITIVLASVIVWAFVFFVSYFGLRFMVTEAKIPPDGRMVGLLIDLMFFTLGIALTFSTGLILHGSLFSGPETDFLLARPVTADHVFAYKFQTAVGFSSWAFLLLGGPVLIAYGIIAGATWWFYLVLPLFFLGFILVPGSVGAFIALMLVNFVPKQRRTVMVLLIVAVVLMAGLWIWSTLAEGRRIGQEGSDPMSEAAGAILNRIAFARSLWLPNAWVTRGLQAAGRGEWWITAEQLLLLWSHGLFLYIAVTWLAGQLYRRGYNRVSTGGDLRRKHGGAWLDNLLAGALFWVHPGTRQLIIKDFRTFRRDPQQWGQVLLFTILLFAYFTNLKRMFIRGLEWPYQNGLSFLNLCAVALLLCTYTGRFIYPLLSLEGRKFWILGLLPLERDRILWGKFGFATVGGLLLALPMVLLSDAMLEMPGEVLILHAVAVTLLAAGLSGLAVGLGACMPNFRETDPSKIAVGFGGTVNLVVGLLFLMVVIVFLVGPYHALMAPVSDPSKSPTPWFWLYVGIGQLLGILAAVVAIALPLRWGIRNLRTMEF
jgi:ABC-2 type transport system permease protein